MLTLHGSVLELQGLTQSSNLTAPLVVASDIMCANLNAELWNGCIIDDVANLAVGDILVCSNVITRTFVRLPIGADGSVLTCNSAVSLGIEWV